MRELQISLIQDPACDGALDGLSYWHTVDAMAQGTTLGLEALWASLRAFEPPPPAPLSIREGHAATYTAIGDCMPSAAPEWQQFDVDDRLPIRPGDLVAFIYRRGIAPQSKLYLGTWYGGDHSPLSGARKIDTVFVFAQEKPRTILLISEEDLVSAIRVSSVPQWAVDPRTWEGAARLLALVSDVDMEVTPIESFAAAAETERQSFFRFLISRFNSEEQEAFYQRHPQARAIAEAAGDIGPATFEVIQPS